MRRSLLIALFILCGTILVQAETIVTLRSSDISDGGGPHGGRPYHLFNDPNDEAIYLTTREWQGGHHPNDPTVWPISDGILDWPATVDPVGAGPEAIVYQDEDTYFVYWNEGIEDYVLVLEGQTPAEGLEKVYYEDWLPVNYSLSIGNNGVPPAPPPPPPFYPSATADRQHALLAEFKLERAYAEGVSDATLLEAWIELTFDRVVDMALNNDPSLMLPSQLFVNTYEGDGILGSFENAQTDYQRINHPVADVTVWLTIEGTPNGIPISDFALSYYRLVTNPGEQFTIQIDVTESVRNLLANQVDFAGFALSTSSDGEFCLGSIDLVDDADPGNIMNYLPALVLNVQIPTPGDFNENGEIDMEDLGVFINVLLGLDTTPEHLEIADMNGDTYANGLDIQPFVDGILTAS